MGLVIFLRHGQAVNNTEKVLAGRTPGVPLTPEGREQARGAAGLLERLGVSAVYSSPIQRAHDTARIVAEHNSLGVTLDERLIELEMGDFTGMKYDDIIASRGDVFSEFYRGGRELAEAGVETFDHVKSRIGDIAEHVIKKHPGQNVVLVTHMDPIKAMLAAVIDPGPERLSDIIIPNASLNLFREHGGRLYMSAINLMHPSRFGQDW